MADKFFTLKEVAEKLQCSQRNIKDLIRSGKLTCYRPHYRLWLIKESDLDSFLEQRKMVR